MAIYHLSATPISRSQGKSSVASAAYRAGEKLYDERQEMTFNYVRKRDVLYKEILLPKGAPEWMLDRGRLWNYVESRTCGHIRAILYGFEVVFKSKPYIFAEVKS
jgi:hypothetical protein